MKLKTRLYVIVGSAAASLAWFCAASLIVAVSIKGAVTKNAVSREIIRAVFELNVLRSEHQSFYEERPYLQWQARHRSLIRLIGKTRGFFNQPQEKKYLESIVEHAGRMGPLFNQLRSRQKPEISATLRSQLLEQSQESVASASQLAQHSHKQVMNSVKLLMGLILLYVLNMVFIMIWAYRWMISKVIVPIRQLQEGVHRISRGDLTHKIELHTRDELAYLGRAFDKMTANLLHSYEKVKTELEARKEAESKLRRFNEELEKRVKQRTQELELSNKELEQFAYVSSHDLQEPLRTISNYVDLLTLTAKGRLDQESAEFLGFIQEGALRALELIRELLAYASIGAQGPQRQEHDFEALLNQTLSNLRSSIEETGAVITCGPLPKLQVVDVQIIQLLQNLISNAVKYRGKNKPRIHITARQEDSQWFFSVKDNGIGIKPEYRDLVFMIFKRLHSRSEYPGTGIGLAICKKIAQYHGGDIWIESEPGKGSTFIFSIQTAPSPVLVTAL